MKTLIAIIAGMLLLGGCSTATKNEINAEKSQIGSVESRSEMVERTRSILANSPNLSAEQRNDFVSLHDEILSEIAELDQEIRKSKLVLFNAMTSKKYDPAKVRVLSRSLKKLHDKKFDVMLQGMEKGRDILGVAAPEILDEAWKPHGEVFY